MVIDHLWNRVCPEGGVICFPCFEKRLGWQIKSTDLKPEVLVNSPLLILLRRLEEFTGMWSAPSIPVVQGPSNSRYFTW
jgi:hypothetical protein